MNFDWTEEQKALQKRIVGAFPEALRAQALALDEADIVAIKDTVLNAQKTLAEIGYLQLAQAPEQIDRLLDLIAAQEELAPLSTSLFMAVETSARLFGGLIATHGSPALKERVLAPLHKGELIGAIAVAEGESKEMPAPRTIAVADGGGYKLTGEKIFVTNGPIADYFAVHGMVVGQEAFFIIPADAKGLAVGPRRLTMGCRGLAVGSLHLQEVHVPAEFVLGPFSDERAIDRWRTIESLVIVQSSIGLMRRLLGAATTHAKKHRRGGKAIIAYQEVGFKLAEMLTMVQTAQLYGRRAAWLIANNDRDAETVTTCAKVFCAESAEMLASMTMQIFAGEGYLAGSVAERGYRDAKYAALAGLSCEVSRMQIADDVLAIYQG